eukprot:jgi/Ulvmu1/898/UM101_0006.1
MPLRQQALKDLAEERAVAQEYIRRPMLIGGLKFDIRVYALVLCAEPLSVFVFRRGLVRFATVAYRPPTSGNLSTQRMHLTNYAVNRRPGASPPPPAATVAGEHSTLHGPGALAGDATAAEQSGIKWSLEALYEYLDDNGHSSAVLWAAMKDIIVKSLLAVQPLLAHEYALATAHAADPHRCFEVLGYDLLLDSAARPWLVEVNHSPSFQTDAPLDVAVKSALIGDALRLARPEPAAARRFRKEMKQESIMRLNGKKTTKPGRRTSWIPAPDPGASTPDAASIATSSQPGSTGRGPPPPRRPGAVDTERAAMLRRRAAFEARPENCGGWERAYPPACAEAAAAYAECLAAARAAFESHHSCRLRVHLDSLAARHMRQPDTAQHGLAAAPRPSPDAAHNSSRPHPQPQTQARVSSRHARPPCAGYRGRHAGHVASPAGYLQGEPGESDDEARCEAASDGRSPRRSASHAQPTAAAQGLRRDTPDPRGEQALAPQPPHVTGATAVTEGVSGAAARTAARAAQQHRVPPSRGVSATRGSRVGMVHPVTTTTQRSDGAAGHVLCAVAQVVSNAPAGDTHAVPAGKPTAAVAAGGNGAATGNSVPALPPAGDIGKLQGSMHERQRPAAPGGAVLTTLTVHGRCPAEHAVADGDAAEPGAAARVAAETGGVEHNAGAITTSQCLAQSDNAIGGSCRGPDGRHACSGAPLHVDEQAVGSSAAAVACQPGELGVRPEKSGHAAREMQRATVPAHADSTERGSGAAEVRVVRGSLSLERVAVRGRRPARHSLLDTGQLPTHVHSSRPAAPGSLWGRAPGALPQHVGGLQAMHMELAGNCRNDRARDAGASVPLRAASLDVPHASVVRLRPGLGVGDGMHAGGLFRGASQVAQRVSRGPIIRAGSLQAAVGRPVATGGMAAEHARTAWAQAVRQLQGGCVGAAGEAGAAAAASAQHVARPGGNRKSEAPRETVIRLLRSAAPQGP